MSRPAADATGSPGRVVVGLDASSASDAALDLALLEARVLGDEVQVVHALPAAVRLEVADPGAWRRAQLVLDAAVTRSRSRIGGADIPVRLEVAAGRPDLVLAERARPHDLLVVGAHGAWRSTAQQLGATAQACASLPPCPLAIVPALGPRDRWVGRVVLGLLPSAERGPALTWAVEAADRHRCPLVVVAAWSSSDLDHRPTRSSDAAALVEARVLDLLERADVLGQVVLTQVQVLAPQMTPAAALRSLTRPGDLLVLGSRGRAGCWPAGLSSTGGELAVTGVAPVVLVP